MFSIITCVSDIEKYKNILMPSLHQATRWLWDNKLKELDTITVYGKDFKNIAEAYNEGIERAKHPIKIFIHEDLNLIDPSWLFKVCYGFSQPNVGMLGLVGTTLPSISESWWKKGTKYIYGKQYVRQDKTLWSWGKIPLEGMYEGIKVVDGCFLATNQKLYFDESLGTDEFFFTPYEHDLSSQILMRNLKIGIMNHLTWHKCSDQSSIFTKPKEVSERLFYKINKRRYSTNILNTP